MGRKTMTAKKLGRFPRYLAFLLLSEMPSRIHNEEVGGRGGRWASGKLTMGDGGEGGELPGAMPPLRARECGT